MCLLGSCVWPLCFESVVFFSICESLSALSHVNRDRRCQICHSPAAFCPISPAHSVLFSHRSAGYSQKRLTENLKVPYYVGEQFSKEFTGVNLKNLERTVEDDYISNLRNNCWKEKQQSLFDLTIRVLILMLFLYVVLVCMTSFCVVSNRGRHAVQSALFWRQRTVPESTEGSHTKLRQAVRDHSFFTRLRMH